MEATIEESTLVPRLTSPYELTIHSLDSPARPVAGKAPLFAVH